MGDIKDYNPAEEETLDNREAIEMVEEQYKNLFQDINGYIENMKQGTESKIELSEFFILSIYTDGIGRKLPCSLVAKKGREFITDKFISEKGAKLTVMHVARFNIMEEREKVVTGGKTAKNGKTPEELAAADKWATAMLLNAKNWAASFLQKPYDRAGTKPEYQAMILSDFYSEDGIHLPCTTLQDTKQTYSKSIIAKKLGVYSKASGGKMPHAQAIDAIISTLDISEGEREQLPYCNNEHDDIDYQYTESVAEKMQIWIEAHGRPNSITVNGKNHAVVYKKE